jgi:hypothetical protein
MYATYMQREGWSTMCDIRNMVAVHAALPVHG